MCSDAEKKTDKILEEFCKKGRLLHIFVLLKIVSKQF
jgi:hypothetical protein